MKILLIFSLLFLSEVFASDSKYFELKEPYPVCIEELKILEPNIPNSFFDLKKEKSISEDLSTPCNDFLCNESKRNNFGGLTAFFQNDFSKIEQELFAKDLLRNGRQIERMKILNDTLTKCQQRTAELHKIASQAAGDIYDETDIFDKIPEGYFIADKKRDFFIFPDSDVKAYILRPKEPNDKNLPPIISFAGTRSLKSAVSDITYGASQVNNVKIKFLIWVNELTNEGREELVITGHSLGGGLAQALASTMPEPNNLKTHVVTFNGFGGKDAINTYNTIYGNEDKDKDYDRFQPTRDSVGYRMEGDVVSLLGERFGETRTIPSKYSTISLVQNHLMATIDDRVANNADTFTQAKKDDVSSKIRPISFVVKTAAAISSLWNKVNDGLDGVFDKTCEGPYQKEKMKSTKCESPDGDALLCLSQGIELKSDGKSIVQAMEKFKTGCELCQKDSCMEYAVLNKIVGYQSRTLSIAKKACDLGDGQSCIEAGNMIEKKLDNKLDNKLDDKYIVQGCAFGEKSLCAFTSNPDFVQRYNDLKETRCKGVKSIIDCELIYLSSDSSKEYFGKKLERIEHLVSEKNGNLEVKNSMGNTPLMLATISGNIEVVKYLTSKKVNIDDKDLLGDTVIFHAISSGNLELVKMFIEKAVNLNATNAQGETPLSYAVTTGNSELVKIILEKGINVDVKNQRGETPLSIAALNGDLNLVSLLLKNGANLDIKNNQGNNAIVSAIGSGSLETTKFLLKNGAKIDVKNSSENPTLNYPLTSGNLEMVKFLVDNKYLSIDSKTQQGSTPIHMAAMSGNLELVKYLQKKGASLESKNNLGDTPLMEAVSSGNLEMVKFFLDKHVTLDVKNSIGNTPLTSAIATGNLDMVNLLIKNGIKLDLKNEQVFSVSSAVLSGKIEMLKFVVKNGGNLDLKDMTGRTPLALAVYKNDIEIVNFLISHGAKIDKDLAESADPKINQYLRKQMDNPFDVLKQSGRGN